MFTAHKADLAEARAGQTERSAAAEFAAILPKPFDLDELLAAVGQAISPRVEPTS
jgi:CheY-like chemotaxis protein